MSNSLIREKLGATMIVRFNQPESRSPLSIDILESLLAIVGEIEYQTGIDSLVFTGVAGVFASGANLKEIAKVNDENDASEFSRRGQTLMGRIEGLRCMTVAAINGLCFGGALDLALACKRRIATSDALFAHPGVDLGIMTGWGGTQRLPRLIGQAKALEMFFTAKRVGAREALSIGLIDAIDEDPLALALH